MLKAATVFGYCPSPSVLKVLRLSKKGSCVVKSSMRLLLRVQAAFESQAAFHDLYSYWKETLEVSDLNFYRLLQSSFGYFFCIQENSQYHDK